MMELDVPRSSDGLPAPHGTDGQSAPGQMAALQAENVQLRADVEQLRTERGVLLERQRNVMELIGAKTAEHLLHDLRNVLNERELLRTLTADQLE